MRDNGSIKPVKLSEHPDYFVVRDSHIPADDKTNIILKPSGIEIIAKEYFQKYGVVICVCKAFLKINALAEKIHAYLSAAKNEFSSVNKIGFIFISNDDPDDVFGHALPMIWEKDNQEEHLFFLDTTQYLGETLSHKLTVGVQAFRKKLLSLMPQLKLWSVFGCRQIDYSSCYTDALVVLRDGLRTPSLLSLLKTKIKARHADITIFYQPEILLRTAQIGSYPEKSCANLESVIRLREKAGEKSPETLEQFRDKFNKMVDVRGDKKQFCAFTLFKAKQYVEKTEKEKSMSLSS